MSDKFEELRCKIIFLENVINKELSEHKIFDTNYKYPDKNDATNLCTWRRIVLDMKQHYISMARSSF